MNSRSTRSTAPGQGVNTEQDEGYIGLSVFGSIGDLVATTGGTRSVGQEIDRALCVLDTMIQDPVVRGRCLRVVGDLKDISSAGLLSNHKDHKYNATLLKPTWAPEHLEELPSLVEAFRKIATDCQSALDMIENGEPRKGYKLLSRYAGVNLWSSTPGNLEGYQLKSPLQNKWQTDWLESCSFAPQDQQTRDAKMQALVDEISKITKDPGLLTKITDAGIDIWSDKDKATLKIDSVQGHLVFPALLALALKGDFTGELFDVQEVARSGFSQFKKVSHTLTDEKLQSTNTPSWIESKDDGDKAQILNSGIAQALRLSKAFEEISEAFGRKITEYEMKAMPTYADIWLGLSKDLDGLLKEATDETGFNVGLLETIMKERSKKWRQGMKDIWARGAHSNISD